MISAGGAGMIVILVGLTLFLSTQGLGRGASWAEILSTYVAVITFSGSVIGLAYRRRRRPTQDETKVSEDAASESRQKPANQPKQWSVAGRDGYNISNSTVTVNNRDA
jgi:hypothetical protein